VTAECEGRRRAVGARSLLAIYRYVPLLLYALLRAGYTFLPFLRPVLEERLGMSAPAVGEEPVVWLHGSSVGEVSSIGPLVAEIRRRVPRVRIVVTTMTATGKKRAAAELGQISALVAPLDFYPAVRRFVAALRPSLLIVGETEIWPNLVIETRGMGCSIVLVNGRISDRSFPRYRLVRPLMGHVLRSFDLLLMRTETDAKRIVEIGAPADRVRTVGNTKVDILPQPLTAERRARIRQELGIAPSRLVISLGSARSGESEIVLEAVRAAFGRPGPLLIIAPRHINTVPQIEDLCRTQGYAFTTLSKESPHHRVGAETEVLILGRMGRLIEVYAVSDISIVGGTFKPFGGHNPLEPASQGTVTIVGPHTQNIADDIAFLRSGRAALVTDEAELGNLLRDLAGDKARRDEISRQATETIKHRKGVAGECADIMADSGLLP
jgi:3-deoxy-D-manno-octulosonic-acid transferase